MVLLALALGMLATEPAVSAPEAPLVCKAELPAVEGRRLAWFNLMTTRDFQPVSANVIMETDDFHARWQLDGGGLRTAGAMIHFRATLRMSVEPPEPVTLTVVPDPGTAPRPPRFSSIVQLGKPAPGQSVIIATEQQVPNIFGKRVSLVVSDRDGREILRRVLPHPDWRWFEIEVVRAGEAAEAKRLRKACVQDIDF